MDMFEQLHTIVKYSRSKMNVHMLKNNINVIKRYVQYIYIYIYTCYVIYNMFITCYNA